jgi:hypothetical protein
MKTELEDSLDSLDTRNGLKVLSVLCRSWNVEGLCFYSVCVVAENGTRKKPTASLASIRNHVWLERHGVKQSHKTVARHGQECMLLCNDFVLLFRTIAIACCSCEAS